MLIFHRTIWVEICPAHPARGQMTHKTRILPHVSCGLQLLWIRQSGSRSYDIINGAEIASSTKQYRYDSGESHCIRWKDSPHQWGARFFLIKWFSPSVALLNLIFIICASCCLWAIQSLFKKSFNGSATNMNNSIKLNNVSHNCTGMFQNKTLMLVLLSLYS
jgi:hypothetical protein